ncbi:MAG TPA: tetratricopeptide repeat protein, partial [Trueperaceae bacterium]|nr:tetratricopeptide repeat protein [Trueperaceae bacterium]
KAISIYPRLVDAYISLAELELASDPQAALNILRQGSSKVPDATSLHRKFLEIAVDLGEENGALSYLKETLANYPIPPVSIYNLATILPYSLNNEAIKIVRDGRIQHPGNPILALSEAELLGRSNDFATAEVVLNDALASNLGDTGLAAALATAQAKQGKVTAAANTIYSVRGHTDEADFEIAQIYLEAGDAVNAANLLEQLVSKHSDSATILGLYGIALARRGDKSQGLVYLDRALTLDPSLAFAKRAKQLISEEDSLSGGQAPALTPDAQVLYDQGIAAFQNADYQAATGFFADSRKIQDSGRSAFYQALSEYHNGNTRAAARAMKRALDDFPNTALVLNDMSQIQLELGRFDLAEEYAKKAIAVDSEYADAYLNLGMVYYRTGQYAKALNQWNEAIKIDPSNQSFLEDLMTDAQSKQ